MLRKIYDSLLTLAYPQICLVCGRSVESSADGAACAKCWRKTRLFSGAEMRCCAKCSAFLEAKPAAQFETFCRRCDAHFYDRAHAVGLYENALAASVIYLKREPFVARRLKKLFLEAFENSSFRDATVAMPVPLSKKRRLERGFNQAEILAAILAQEFDLKTDSQSLARGLHTPLRRAGMDARARALTVEKAFEVTRPKFVRGAKILLVDDVFTSGATASACAENLKKKGADKVYILTLARAI